MNTRYPRLLFFFQRRRLKKKKKRKNKETEKTVFRTFHGLIPLAHHTEPFSSLRARIPNHCEYFRRLIRPIIKARYNRLHRDAEVHRSSLRNYYEVVEG